MAEPDLVQRRERPPPIVHRSMVTPAPRLDSDPRDAGTIDHCEPERTSALAAAIAGQPSTLEHRDDEIWLGDIAASELLDNPRRTLGSMVAREGFEAAQKFVQRLDAQAIRSGSKDIGLAAGAFTPGIGEQQIRTIAALRARKAFAEIVAHRASLAQTVETRGAQIVDANLQLASVAVTVEARRYGVAPSGTPSASAEAELSELQSAAHRICEQEQQTEAELARVADRELQARLSLLRGSTALVDVSPERMRIVEGFAAERAQRREALATYAEQASEAFPALRALSPADLAAIASARPEVARSILASAFEKTRSGILNTRERLAASPDLIWRFPAAIEAAKTGLGIADLTIDAALIDDYRDECEANQAQADLLMAGVGTAVGILATVLTVGYAAALLISFNATQITRSANKLATQTDAHHTALDPQASLQPTAPSATDLAIDLAAMALDIGIPALDLDLARTELKASKLALETADGPVWRVATAGLRNEIALTRSQRAEVVAYARALGMPEEAILFSDSMNTGYKNLFGQDVLYIGTDVLPSSTRGATANARVSMRGALAHEIVGHRSAELAGRTQRSLVLEEAQASFRAAFLAPGLNRSERLTLMRDGLERLRNAGVRLRDVRTGLWIEGPRRSWKMLLMTVHDVQSRPGKGIVLAGTNPVLNSKSEPEIRELFGIEVELHKPGAGPIRIKVLGVETSTSIANQKNIFVLVDGTGPRTVVSGSEIHSIRPARNGAP